MHFPARISPRPCLILHPLRWRCSVQLGIDWQSPAEMMSFFETPLVARQLVTPWLIRCALAMWSSVPMGLGWLLAVGILLSPRAIAKSGTQQPVVLPAGGYGIRTEFSLRPSVQTVAV